MDTHFDDKNNIVDSANAVNAADEKAGSKSEHLRFRLAPMTGSSCSPARASARRAGWPTFRGAGGLWHGHRVEDVASPEAWKRDPELVWNFYSMRRKEGLGGQAEPGATWRWPSLSASWASDFFCARRMSTDLHERAGSKRLVHMHGELFQSRCESCDARAFRR